MKSFVPFTTGHNSLFCYYFGDIELLLKVCQDERGVFLGYIHACANSLQVQMTIIKSWTLDPNTTTSQGKPVQTYA